VLKSAYYAAGAALAGIQKQRPIGRPIWATDWDSCIVLDSARADTLAACAPADWRCGDAWSVGSVTTEWLTNTCSRRYADDVADTALVSATPHTQTVFDDRHWLTDQGASPVAYPESPAVSREDFRAVYELWRTHATDHNVVPPDVMRDATLEAYDRHGPGVVAHWMQPHEPFIAPEAAIVGGDATAKNVWEGAQAGRLDADDVVQSYEATLKYVLPYVVELLESVDADVLITADHGNAFGEWGIWGHPFGWPQPAVRKVPWVEIEATANQPRDYSSVLDETGEQSDVEGQLRALGYR